MLGTRNSKNLAGVLSLAAVVLAGCGGADTATDGPPAQAGDSGDPGGVQQLAVADLTTPIGEYMPRPLDGGILEIAGPESWDWKNPSSDQHLVGFIPAGVLTLNSFPRILVSVEDAADYSMQTADAGNIAQLAEEIGAELPEKTTAEPARPMIVGEHPCVTYVIFARSGKAVVKRQFAKVLVDGRIYTVMLEDYDRVFAKSRQAALTVVAGMRFLDSPADGETDVSSPAGDEAAAGDL